MTLGRLIRNLISVFLVVGIFMGLCFMGLEFLLNGEGYATFYGYQITSSHNDNNDNFCHVGNAVIIKTAKKDEIHHDTPIAIYDENSKLYYIYRVISKSGDKITAVGKCGEIISTTYKEVVGRVLET